MFILCLMHANRKEKKFHLNNIYPIESKLEILFKIKNNDNYIIIILKIKIILLLLY